MNQQKIQAMMTEVATYCSSSNSVSSSSSSSVLSRPVPGAVCCAQFSGEEYIYSFLFLHYLHSELSRLEIIELFLLKVKGNKEMWF